MSIFAFSEINVETYKLTSRFLDATNANSIIASSTVLKFIIVL
jgi:hypothetical protein